MLIDSKASCVIMLDRFSCYSLNGIHDNSVEEVKTYQILKRSRHDCFCLHCSFMLTVRYRMDQLEPQSVYEFGTDTR